MKKITVFCGSSPGTDAIYREQAILLGATLASRGIELIYGGARIGLMGAVADAVLEGGGNVTGVIPDFLSGKEVAHDGLSELIIVETMHERKALMHELGEGVMALPGGYGTMEELFEMLTWGQLGLHSKPMGILNINGYYDGLIELIDAMASKGFLKQVDREMLLVSDSIVELLMLMNNYKAPHLGKFLSEEDV